MACGTVCLVAMGALRPVAASDLSLILPPSTTETRAEMAALSSYALPTGIWQNGILPVEQREGQILRRAYRIEDNTEGTLGLIAPLRDQLRAAGYDIGLECAATACGGFDFRFATEILPEPDMHVDLGDYRFLAATRGRDEAVTVLVSRSVRTGHVQIVQVSPPMAGAASADGQTPDRPPPRPTGASAPPNGSGVATTLSTANRSATALPPGGAAPAEALDDAGRLVLEGLEFASGEARLTGGDDTALKRLADWLRADAGRSVTLVGHTDASGALQGNVILSRRRAEAVRDTLVQQYGISAGRIAAEGVGYLSPRDDNRTEQGRMRNRRVEAIVTSTR